MHVNKGLTSIQTGKVKHFSFKNRCWFFWCKHMDVSLTCWNAWSPHGFVMLLIQNLQVTHFAFWKHHCDRPPRSPFPASACLLKAVSLPPRLAELTNMQWSQKAAESPLMRSLWWLICFISTSSFLSLHLVECWPLQRRSAATALCARELFSMQNPPTFPFWSEPLKIN